MGWQRRVDIQLLLKLLISWQVLAIDGDSVILPSKLEQTIVPEALAILVRTIQDQLQPLGACPPYACVAALRYQVGLGDVLPPGLLPALACDLLKRLQLTALQSSELLSGMQCWLTLGDRRWAVIGHNPERTVLDLVVIGDPLQIRAEGLGVDFLQLSLDSLLQQPRWARFSQPGQYHYRDVRKLVDVLFTRQCDTSELATIVHAPENLLSVAATSTSLLSSSLSRYHPMFSRAQLQHLLPSASGLAAAPAPAASSSAATPTSPTAAIDRRILLATAPKHGLDAADVMLWKFSASLQATEDQIAQWRGRVELFCTALIENVRDALRRVEEDESRQPRFEFPWEIDLQYMYVGSMATRAYLRRPDFDILLLLNRRASLRPSKADPSNPAFVPLSYFKKGRKGPVEKEAVKQAAASIEEAIQDVQLALNFPPIQSGEVDLLGEMSWTVKFAEPFQFLSIDLLPALHTAGGQFLLDANTGEVYPNCYHDLQERFEKIAERLHGFREVTIVLRMLLKAAKLIEADQASLAPVPASIMDALMLAVEIEETEWSPRWAESRFHEIVGRTMRKLDMMLETKARLVMPTDFRTDLIARLVKSADVAPLRAFAQQWQKTAQDPTRLLCEMEQAFGRLDSLVSIPPAAAESAPSASRKRRRPQEDAGDESKVNG